MQLNILSISELQSMGAAGDIDILAELGKRVLDLRIHEHTGGIADYVCNAQWDLDELQRALDNEIPPECPRCGKWLTDV